jgi:hypothetical protein
VADLGASAYGPTIVGVDPNSVLNTAIGNAVSAFFAHNETKFHIGSIAPGKVPSLMPTDFHFTTQQKANADACLLLLIQTNGPAGTNGPLATYPIPDGHTAGLLISERALFNGALVDPLNASFKNFGVHFSGNNANGSWTTTGSGGAISVGQVGGQNKKWPDGRAWSSDSNCNEAPVSISLNGFSLSASNGQIVASWNCKQPQYWSVYNCNVPIGGMPQVCGSNAFPTSILVNYTQTFDVIMKSGSDSTVAFNNHAPTLTAIPTDFPSGWNRLWLGDHVPSTVITSIGNALATVFKDFSVPDVNTFALTSLLFPSQHAVHLKDVALPAGLYLTGILDQPIAVTPARTTLTPGQSVQLPRVRREEALDEYERSGVQFAAHVGIKYSTLANWIQKREARRQQEKSLIKAESGPQSTDGNGTWVEAVIERAGEPKKQVNDVEPEKRKPPRPSALRSSANASQHHALRQTAMPSSTAIERRAARD